MLKLKVKLGKPVTNLRRTAGGEKFRPMYLQLAGNDTVPIQRYDRYQTVIFGQFGPGHFD